MAGPCPPGAEELVSQLWPPPNHDRPDSAIGDVGMMSFDYAWAGVLKNLPIPRPTPWLLRVTPACGGGVAPACRV